jgi:hypothetical protein
MMVGEMPEGHVYTYTVYCGAIQYVHVGVSGKKSTVK